MIKFKLNGHVIKVEEGTTILKAAQELGFDIPTLCYHPALEPYQVCRVCLVELIRDGKSQLVPSCGYKVEEGTEVHTNSEEVIEERKMIVELILAQAPHSEKVKEIAQKLGIEKSSFEAKKEKECILCGLCVRACNELMEIGTIGFAHRGGEREVTTPYKEFNDICSTCGACAKICPTDVIKLEEITQNKVTPIRSRFETELSSRPCIYVPFPQAVPKKPVIDRENCMYFKNGACKTCEAVCQPDAIDYAQEDVVSEIDVGAVVVASGIDYFDPTEASEFGYRRFKNVVTSFELERLLSAGGPTKGELLRLTDNKPPKKIAFINCVGSRNMARDIPYCSRICCMNAIKDSLIVKEFFPDAEVYIFYIDIRAFGKGFEELYNRSLEEGVKYVKGKPSKVVEDPKTGDLTLSHENQKTGKIEHMQVDMVVLSSAIIPSEGTNNIAQMLGVETEKDGFFKQKDACGYPLESTRDGVYLCGCATGPKDITDSIAEASGAAAKAALLVDDRVEEVKTEVKPIDVSGEPRVGVFVCHCGLNIAGLLPCESLAEYAKTLQNVVHAEDVLFSCAESTQRQIQELIQEHNLNRIVVAACTPRTHEPIFQETLDKVGLNPYLFDMVNIRDQCSWVHQKEPEAAAEKAKDLIRMAIARVRLLSPLEKRELEVNQDILIIGGGIAGMQAAIDFASRGFTVHLVEKESQLGGRVRNLASLYPQDESGKELIERKLAELKKFGVNVHISTTVENIDGFVGNFEVTLQEKEKKEPFALKAGAIVLAIGSDLFRPHEKHGYQKFANVKSNMELEEMVLQNKLPDMKSVAFIQCVGSRGPEGNPGCSRYCCQAAIKQAIKLREKGIDVTIFHRGIRVYSKGAEMMYRKARELGVLFLEYPDDGFPKLAGKDTVEQIEVYSRDLDTDIVVPVDMAVLSCGMIPKTEESQRLSEMLRVSRGPDKFFLERHPKFGPVETSVDGVYLCGCCQFPQDIADSIAQASAVASRALALLSRGLIRLEPVVSSIDDVLCRGCGQCAEVCEFKAIELIEKTKGIWVARVNEALCKGCGSCCAVCPTGASDIRHFQRDQIEAELEALFE